MIPALNQRKGPEYGDEAGTSEEKEDEAEPITGEKLQNA